MQKKYIVTLNPEEQVFLGELIKRRNAKSIEVKRAYVLLAADENGDKKWTDDHISDVYHVRRKTVENIRQRFVEEAFKDVLKGKKREINKEKIFTGEIEAKLIALRCSESPEGYNKWTLRLLADKMVELEYVESMSHESVRQILKKTKGSLGR